MKLTIKGTGRVIPHGYKVLLDDVDVTSSCRELVLRMSAMDVNELSIRLAPDEVEVDADALAALQAILRTQEGDR